MAALAPILPYVMAGASAVSGLASYQNSQYQSAVASQNADLLAQQAQRETFAANQDISDNDTAARAEMAEMISQMNASGINSTSGSLLFKRAGLQQLATRDRERLATKRDIALENTKRQEQGQRTEAKAAKKAGKFGLLSTLLSVPTSFLSGSSMLNEYNKGRLALSAPSYAKG